MSEWLMDAAHRCDFPAQATSIPGVAQRTGATTYYLEIFPAPRSALGGREPVMALTPSPGHVDLMVASELIEAARAMQNGFVSPERTTLVASTHRIYATVEKMQMGDGRFESSRVIEAARQLARKAILFDMRNVAQNAGTVINAVLFGAMAGSGALPLPRDACEAAIRDRGRGAEASLRGFAAGFDLARATATPQAAAPAARRPHTAQEFVDLGVARLRDYQGDAYAELYLARLKSLSADPQLLAEVARHLAVWMSYEDIIRVADLKTRPARFQRVRREVGAREGEPVIVIDYLKPGLDEFASLLPPALGRWLVDWARKRGKLDAYNIGLHVRTSGVLGYLATRALAWLRPWRPYCYRYQEEQRRIERWLSAIREAVPKSSVLAIEIAACARLVKGYGDTHRRGLARFEAIFETLVENGAIADPGEQAKAIGRAREAALADPDGKALQRDLGRPVVWLSKIS
jgi:indolepyruvate ferredoxin oxidoreductase beta subunit